MMPTDILPLIVSLLVPIILGWFMGELLFFATKKSFFFEKIFYAFGLGFGYITLWMLIFSLCGISFRLQNLNIPLFITLLVLLPLRLRKVGKINKLAVVTQEKTSIIRILLQCVIVFIFLLIFFRTMVIEANIWDSWAFWGFKAKVFFVHQSIPFTLFPTFKTVWGNWDYPVHVPLMETWIYLILGYWNDHLSRLIFPFFDVGICVIIYYFLKTRISRNLALWATLLFASFEQLHVYAVGTVSEPILLFYYIGSFLLLCRWAEEREATLLIGSAIFVGLSGWTKNEGIFFLVCNFCTLGYILWLQEKNLKAIIKNKLLWLYLVIGMLIILPWRFIVIKYGLSNFLFNAHNLNLTYIFQNTPKLLSLIPTILNDFILNIQAWNLTWIMFLIFLIRFRGLTSKSTLLKCILVPIILQWGIFVFMYIIMYDRDVYVYDSSFRFMIAPALLSILFCCLSLQSPEKES